MNLAELKAEVAEIGQSLEHDLSHIDHGRGQIHTMEQRLTAVIAAMSVLISTIEAAIPDDEKPVDASTES